MQKLEHDRWCTTIAAALGELDSAPPESRQRGVALADLSRCLYRAQASIERTADEIPRAQATRICRAIQKQIRKHRAKFSTPPTAELRGLFNQLRGVKGALD